MIWIYLVVVIAVIFQNTCSTKKLFKCRKNAKIKVLESWDGGSKEQAIFTFKDTITDWAIEIHFDLKSITSLEVWPGKISKDVEIIGDSSDVVFIKPMRWNSVLKPAILNFHYIIHFTGTSKPNADMIALCGAAQRKDPPSTTGTPIFTTKMSPITTTSPKLTHGCQEDVVEHWDSGYKHVIRFPILENVSSWVLELEFTGPWQSLQQWKCKEISADSGAYICMNLRENSNLVKGDIFQFVYVLNYRESQLRIPKLKQVWLGSYHCISKQTD